MSRSSTPPSAVVGGGRVGEIMLFGVRVKVDPMRKSVSMNNLSEYEPLNNEAAPKAGGGGAMGYASADDAVPQPSSGNRDRKRGVPWSEEEHKLFLIGLQKVGRGDWRGISRNYVKTRTPTQVASHAQKYFIRRNNLNRRRRRSSLFDITTDSVTAMPMEESKNHQNCHPETVTSNVNGFSVVPFPVHVSPVLFSMQNSDPIEIPGLVLSDEWKDIPSSSTMVHDPIATPSHLSLGLSLSSGQDQSSIHMIPGLKYGDSYISVA